MRRFALSLVTMLGASAFAQQPPMAGPPVTHPPGIPSAKIWAFTGAWNRPFSPGVVKSGVIPLNATYQAKLEKLQKLAEAGNEVPGNEPRCIPNGMPMLLKFGFQLFADDKRLLFSSTNNGQQRYIWIDGRAHTPANQTEDSYSGESIGHFEGDTLVIDTTGLKSSDEIDFGLSPTDMHIIERWTLISPTTLEDQVEIDDPSVLTKPWKYTVHFTRGALSSTGITCVSATDRFAPKPDGSANFDLTPPSGGYVPPGAQ